MKVSRKFIYCEKELGIFWIDQSKISKPSTKIHICKCHETLVAEKWSSQFCNPAMKGLIFPKGFSTKRDEGGSKKDLWEVVSREEERDETYFFPLI